MKRLLIADSSEPFAAALEEALSTEFECRICTDGETALQFLLNFQPDYLILNLQLPYKDGLTVLQEAAFLPSIVLATTSYLSPYIEQAAAALGVSYIMVTPAVDALCVRLWDLIYRSKSEKSSRNIQEKATVHLHILNFQTHLDGYQQLCIGIPLFHREPSQRLTKELYPAIAHKWGCTDGRAVEHSIRKAIEAAWKKRNKTVWAKYFPVCEGAAPHCPTNKEFISCIAKLL